MEEKKTYVFEEPIKPEIEDLKKIVLDCSEFSEPNKAEALIRSLNLTPNTIIKEDGDEGFLINPRMVLKGDSPNKYKKEIEEVKKILTPSEIKAISLYYRRKKEDRRIMDKLYYGITKRINNLYSWDVENKTHKPNKPKYKEVCESLDTISRLNTGFNNLIYCLLRKENSEWLYCYKCAWFNKQIPNIQKWEEENDGEYMVLTESEADDRAKEYLTDDTYLWELAVKEHRTTDALDEWAEEVIQLDGRGSVLNGYDGNEETEEIEGVTYCVYRTN